MSKSNGGNGPNNKNPSQQVAPIAYDPQDNFQLAITEYPIEGKFFGVQGKSKKEANRILYDDYPMQYATKLFNILSDHSNIESIQLNGRFIIRKFQNGTEIHYRSFSRSGGPVIRIVNNDPNSLIISQKIHFFRKEK